MSLTLRLLSVALAVESDAASGVDVNPAWAPRTPLSS